MASKHNEIKIYIPHLENKLNFLFQIDNSYKTESLAKYIGIRKSTLIKWYKVYENRSETNKNKVPVNHYEKLLSAYSLHSSLFCTEDIEYFKTTVEAAYSNNDVLAIHHKRCRYLSSCLLGEGLNRGIIISGPSGIGKSTLAEMVLNRLRSSGFYQVELVMGPSTILNDGEFVAKFLEKLLFFLKSSSHIGFEPVKNTLKNLLNQNAMWDSAEWRRESINVVAKLNSQLPDKLAIVIFLDDLKDISQPTYQSLLQFLKDFSFIDSRVIVTKRNTEQINNPLEFYVDNIENIEPAEAITYLRSKLSTKLTKQQIGELVDTFSQNLVYLNICVEAVNSLGYSEVSELIRQNEAFITSELIQKYLFPHYISRLNEELTSQGFIINNEELKISLVKLSTGRWCNPLIAEKLNLSELFFYLIKRKDWLSTIGKEGEDPRYTFHDFIKLLLTKSSEKLLTPTQQKKVHHAYVECLEELEELDQLNSLELSLHKQYHLFHYDQGKAIHLYEKLGWRASDSHNLELSAALISNIDRISIKEQFKPAIYLRKGDFFRIRRDFKKAQEIYREGLGLIQKQEEPSINTVLSLKINFGVACIEPGEENSSIIIREGIKQLEEAQELADDVESYWFLIISMMSVAVGYQNLIEEMLRQNEKDKIKDCQELRSLKTKAITTYRKTTRYSLALASLREQECKKTFGAEHSRLKEEVMRYLNVHAKGLFNLAGILGMNIPKSENSSSEKERKTPSFRAKYYEKACVMFRNIGNLYWEAKSLLGLIEVKNDLSEELKIGMQLYALKAFNSCGQLADEYHLCKKLLKEGKNLDNNIRSALKNRTTTITQ